MTRGLPVPRAGKPKKKATNKKKLSPEDRIRKRIKRMSNEMVFEPSEGDRKGRWNLYRKDMGPTHGYLATPRTLLRVVPKVKT